jgi:hypothetical protein
MCDRAEDVKVACYVIVCGIMDPISKSEYFSRNYSSQVKGKGKAVLLQAWTGLQGD